MTLSRRDILASSAALAVTASAARGAPTQAGGEQGVAPSPQEALLEKLQGGWVLREMDAPDIEEKDRQEKAFMVIGGTFLAIELQLAWGARDNDEWVDGYFQSGVSRLWVERSNVLVARGLIGATTDENYGIELEPPGKERRYRVRFYGKDELELTMEDGPRFTFKRLQNGVVRRDASGRPVKDTDR